MSVKDITDLLSKNEFEIQGSHNNSSRNKAIRNSEGKLAIVADIHYHSYDIFSKKSDFSGLTLQSLNSLKFGIIKKGPTDDKYILVNPSTGVEEQFFYQDAIAVYISDYEEDKE